MKTLKIVTEIKVKNWVSSEDIVEWVSGHMDNIPEEILAEESRDGIISYGVTSCEKITHGEPDEDEVE